MLAVMCASLKKEIREVLRDKRTLLLTILVPLGFYLRARFTQSVLWQAS